MKSCSLTFSQQRIAHITSRAMKTLIKFKLMMTLKINTHFQHTIDYLSREHNQSQRTLPHTRRCTLWETPNSDSLASKCNQTRRKEKLNLTNGHNNRWLNYRKCVATTSSSSRLRAVRLTPTCSLKMVISTQWEATNSESSVLVKKILVWRQSLSLNSSHLSSA